MNQGEYEMTTIRRTEPTTATAAVAFTVGASAVGRLVGGPVVPLSIFQPLAPVAGTVGRIALDNAKRAAWLTLLVAAPMWGGLHGVGFDHTDDGGLFAEVPAAALVVMMVAGYLLLQLRDAGRVSARLERATRTSGHRDETSRWIVLARAIFKRRKRSRVAGGRTFSAAQGAPRPFLFFSIPSFAALHST
jgi:hypothetical protein